MCICMLSRVRLLRARVVYSRRTRSQPLSIAAGSRQSGEWTLRVAAAASFMIAVASASVGALAPAALCSDEGGEVPPSESKALAGTSPRCRTFIAWLLALDIEVVVWDMDLTMGSGHCGEGILRGEAVEQYVAGASLDFVEALRVLAQLPGLKLAVATASDPAEYGLPGQSQDTHLLGPDLASELIGRWCPESLPRFEIMVGHDPRLHPEEPKLTGKSWAMRRIASHYGVDPSRMVLIDDSAHQLETSDGWHGLLVRGRQGFSFDDCLEDAAAPEEALRAWRGAPSSAVVAAAPET